ncbi:YgeY family selenium metabolism-linked hydrolase [Thermanaeromonas sp. C210]|uniref:YgeY family selenium metabolism-linked hydrolase n=1 Tax=Thermanaeromonas sp. C210 TaxID=2731925 RepID=UPI00155C6FF5|nr:YgeY family selenium metabolism-linked hydrolase [Thermanaeromonas sp. C210]GFN22183.1 peptidase [Thermanaeromonas sp. C210]
MELTEPSRKELLDLCRMFLSIPSVTGEEKALADAVKNVMLQLGFDRAWIDERGSVVGVVKGALPGRKVLLDGHLDTVGPGEDRWKYPPFQGTVVEGKIYGRGASDMKGALAAMVYAVGQLAGHRENLKGEIYVSGTVHEETAEGVALGYVLQEVRPDAVVIGEASELKLNIGQRGRAEIVLETYGKAAHSSHPEVGINAVCKMVTAIEALSHLELPRDELLGPAIMELTDIISFPYPGNSVVPGKCRATYDRRLLVGETPEEVVGVITGALQKLEDADPAFRGRAFIALNDFATYTGFRVHGLRFAPAWKMPTEHWVVRGALQALRKANLPPVISAYSFCTNGSSSAGVYGIPTVGFGPGRETEAHIADEYLELDQLYKSAAGYYYLAAELAAGEGM